VLRKHGDIPKNKESAEPRHCSGTPTKALTNSTRSAPFRVRPSTASPGTRAFRLRFVVSLKQNLTRKSQSRLSPQPVFLATDQFRIALQMTDSAANTAPAANQQCTRFFGEFNKKTAGIGSRKTRPMA
jgi:hypothetical protein